MASVEIRGLSKHFGGVAAVRNLSFDVALALTVMVAWTLTAFAAATWRLRDRDLV